MSGYFCTKNLHSTILLPNFAPEFGGNSALFTFGEMVEWSITPVLKTGVLRGTGGSNPSLSAKRLKLVEPELNQFFCFTLRTEACLWTEVEAKKAVATATVSATWQRPRGSARDARQRIPLSSFVSPCGQKLAYGRRARQKKQLRQQQFQPLGSGPARATGMRASESRTSPRVISYQS